MGFFFCSGLLFENPNLLETLCSGRDQCSRYASIEGAIEAEFYDRESKGRKSWKRSGCGGIYLVRTRS
jgi:hypothetical protein